MCRCFFRERWHPSIPIDGAVEVASTTKSNQKFTSNPLECVNFLVIWILVAIKLPYLAKIRGPVFPIHAHFPHSHGTSGTVYLHYVYLITNLDSHQCNQRLPWKPVKYVCWTKNRWVFPQKNGWCISWKPPIFQWMIWWENFPPVDTQIYSANRPGLELRWIRCGAWVLLPIGQGSLDA